MKRSSLFTDTTLERMRAGEIPITLARPGGGIEQATIQLAAAGPDDAHTIEELPTYLAGFSQADYVADKLSPPFQVPNLTGIYRSMNEENTFRRVNVDAGLQDPVPEVGVGSGTAQFRCTIRFCGAFVDRITEANSTAYSPLQMSGKRAANALMLDREIKVWEQATTLANWNANHRVTLGATQHWGTGSASAPIDDLRTAVRASLGGSVHDIWMNWDGIDTFLAHPQVRDYLTFFRGTNGFSELVDKIATLSKGNEFDFLVPQIGRIRVAPARVLNETTGILDYCVENDVVVSWSDTSQPTDGESMSTFKTAKFAGLAGVGIETRRFNVPNRGPSGGEMIVVAMACVELVTGPKIGKLIKAAYG